MNHPLHIEWSGMPGSGKLETLIRDEVEMLEIYTPLISCVVGVALCSQERKQYNVRIDLGLRQNEISIDLQHYPNPRAALRNAFDVARRQLAGVCYRGPLATELAMRGRPDQLSS